MNFLKTVREAWAAFATGVIHAQDLLFDYWRDDEVEVFDGHEQVYCMDFSDALHSLFDGYHIQRAAWDSVYLSYEQTDHPVYAGYQIILYTKSGARTPWLPTQVDILQVDWMLVDSEP
jgi:Protein of unknown function (DUF2829)